MTHPKQLEDTLDCGSPKETWEALREHLKQRANAANQIAFELEQDAKDAAAQAKAHHDQAKEFYDLYEALTNAPVTFAPAEQTALAVSK